MVQQTGGDRPSGHSHGGAGFYPHVAGEASRELQACMAARGIGSTQALVDAFNAAGTNEVKVLEEWLQGYIDWFDAEMGRACPPTSILLEEYSLLAGIQPGTTERNMMLSKFFNGLCNMIDKYKVGGQPLMEALKLALQSMTVEVFEITPVDLETLGQTLLDMVDPAKTSFTEAASHTHCTRLHALHLTLKLLREVAPNQWNATQEGGLYRKFMKQVRLIAKRAEHYPIRYHAHLLEQSLRRLAAAGGKAQFRDQCRRVIQGVEGVISVSKAVKSIVTFEFDINALEVGYDHLEAGFKNLKGGYEALKGALGIEHIKGKSWYDQHQAMLVDCMSSLDSLDKYRVFKEGLTKLRKVSKGDQAGLKVLRFGVVQRLRLLTLGGATAAIRKAGMEDLASLAESRLSSTWKGWLEDKEVLVQLLDCLVMIATHSQGDENEMAGVALQVLIEGSSGNSTGGQSWLYRRRQAAVQNNIEEWLGDQTWEEKLESMKHTGEAVTEGILFDLVCHRLQPMADFVSGLSQELHQALKEHYIRDSFAKVPSLVEKRAPQHVASLQWHTMLIEHVKANGGSEGEIAEQGYDQNGQQDDWTGQQLKNLFDKRITQPGESEREINKVLLVGNLGTGKTTLSRKVAYSWARGECGTKFLAVYVVPVATLQVHKYDNSNDRSEETLATAIANESCPCGEKYGLWKYQIRQDLEDPRTLVVLDGLNERHGTNEKLIDQAMRGRHKLLMLSRPCDVQEERRLADIEVELVGLSEKQMREFVIGELGDGPGQGLLTFIEENPGIRALAHVPIYLQILCATWQDAVVGAQSNDSATTSLTGLCKRIMDWIEKRHMYLEDNVCKAAFKVVEKIGECAPGQANELADLMLGASKGLDEKSRDDAVKVARKLLRAGMGTSRLRNFFSFSRKALVEV